MLPLFYFSTPLLSLFLANLYPFDFPFDFPIDSKLMPILSLTLNPVLLLLRLSSWMDLFLRLGLQQRPRGVCGSKAR